MNVAMVISSMQGGGAERVMATMATYWTEREWDVTVITADDGSLPDFYPLPDRVRRMRLGIAWNRGRLADTFLKSVRLHRQLRHAIRQLRPDAIISFMSIDNVRTLLAAAGTGIPVLVAERNDPAREPLRQPWRTMRRLLYSNAAAVVTQTEDAAMFFRPRLDATLHVIPNPVALPPPEAPPPFAVPTPCIVSVGRLYPQKGFDLLLRAFGSVADRHPEWNLLILGEGDSRTELQQLGAELGIAERIFLPGRTKDPWSILRRSEFFVLSSRYEGFPNALCEAMACGLPVIATDCRSGPRDIITHEHDGLLVKVEDVAALASAMDRLISDPALRRRLAAEAPRIVDRFRLERVMETWENAVAQTVKKSA